MRGQNHSKFRDRDALSKYYMNIVKTHLDFRCVVKVRFLSKIVLCNNVDDKLLPILSGVRSLCLNPASLTINPELTAIFNWHKLV